MRWKIFKLIPYIRSFMRFSFIDLFSGVGGFRVAIEKLGGKCIGFSEIDKNAIEVYRDNFNSKEEIYLGDITKIEKLPKADIFVGGVPCQAWSVAGSKKGFDDPRGKLWEDCIRLVKNSKPKAFIFENVAGFLRLQNGLWMKQALKELNKLILKIRMVLS